MRWRRRWLQRCWLLYTACIFLGRQDQVQRVAFLSRSELHQSPVVHVFDDSFKNLATQALPGHFAPAEEDSGLDLVTLIQEPQHMILFSFVIVIIHVDTKLHFFDRDRHLFLLSFALA